MISLIDENVLSLTEAAALLPRRRAQKRPHVATLYRWASAGCRGVKLEVIRVGGTLCTSREALQRFAEALTGSPQAAKTPRQPRRETELRKTEAELSAAGY